MSTNYAAAFGYHSVAAAVIAALVYLPLFLWFVRQSIKNTTYVYISLTVFCLMRVAAFALRAILIKSTSLAENLNVFIADEVMFGVGFFALLYSAFTLVLDREIVSGAPPVEIVPLRIIRDRRLFRIVPIIGVVLGVNGISDASSSDPNKAASGANLHRASTIIFLVLTLIQALQTALAFTAAGHPASTRFGDLNGKYILAVISLLLIVREVFMVATISNAVRQDKEVLWYPLVALPEVLAVVCYSISGLVPPRAELKKQQELQEFQYGQGV
ncbi:hypothetical protein DFH06DRAFT_91758 [Mycena polygramma]|nr:hypothetical protein DFH06DRAFT_91758 [Mycena polygramma]